MWSALFNSRFCGEVLIITDFCTAIDAMENLAIYQDASLRIQEQFEMGTDDVAETDASVYLKRLRKLLAERIEYMLGHERDHLKWVLYRIDVSEEKVGNILAAQPLYEAVESIADLIIARQVEKAITRKKYSTGAGGMSFDI